MKRKLIAAIACRNTGQRLYGKPSQNLDIKKNISVIAHIVKVLKSNNYIDEIILGISEGVDNLSFKNFAHRNSLRYVIGNEKDVLSRLIKCGKLGRATDIFRITSESPFTFLSSVSEVWKEHTDGNYDASFVDNVIDGCGYDIVKLDSLIYSHKHGSSKHRSELCTLYIRENIKKFNVNKWKGPKYLMRDDLRLTIDYPEDIIVCRAVYKHFKNKLKNINLKEVVKFLDSRKDLKKLIEPYTNKKFKK